MATADHSLPEGEQTRTYRPVLPGTWWLRHRHYFFYMVREFTPIPILIWFLWFLVEVNRLKDGPNGYVAQMSTGFVVFSAVCLFFALWHSITFLSLSGLILRIPFGERVITGRPIQALAFAGMVAATVVIGFLLIWLGR